METATIVTLGNSGTSTPTSFEDAFGEFSEARGRGRARRQKRRTERIANRKTSRTQRQQGRLEKKKARVSARAERRSMRADSREQRRDQKSAGKRGRERADLEQEREFAPDETTEGSYEQDPSNAPQSEDSGYAPQGGGYAEEEGGYAEEQGGGGYAEEDGGYDEQGGYEEEGGYAEEGGYDEESDGFDGVIENGTEMIDVPYNPQVSQEVADAAKRIEWNLELASRLKEKAKSTPNANVSDAISSCNKRVSELESSLEGYCQFEGDFTSDANGGNVYCPRTGGSQIAPARMRRRRGEVATAKMQARRERNAVRRKSGLTPVQGELTPQISPNRIVIPAKEMGSNATGIIGLDNAMDYDANATEIKLGADGGTTSKIPFKAIAIGLGVGVLAIIVLRKYKII